MQPEAEIYEIESFTALSLGLSQNEKDILVFFYLKIEERASVYQVEDSS